jgi:hypothetical protein
MKPAKIELHPESWTPNPTFGVFFAQHLAQQSDSFIE